ncbi:hypothetical protein Ciccas_008669 [Cichlidogyrus casuarinus]|uniref:Dynein heavy chain linker domain-containing protein n=1 Tax=Cichlidogyrus casuarinus TaxID=1844966 RepID=A0ABD2PZ87_9PLAT
MEFLIECSNALRKLTENLTKSQENKGTIMELMPSFVQPMFKSTSGESILTPVMVETLKSERYQQISKIGQQILELVRENAQLLGVESESTDGWADYKSSLVSSIARGLCSNITESLNHLQESVCIVTSNLKPFFECTVALVDDKLKVMPGLDSDVQYSLLDTMDKLMEDIVNQSLFIPLLTLEENESNHQVEVYKELVFQMPTIESNMTIIADCIMDTMSQALKVVSDLGNRFELYCQLTDDEFAKNLDTYAKTGFVDENFDFALKSLDDFHHLLADLRKVLKNIEELPTIVDIDFWLRLRFDSFKEAISQKLKRWLQKTEQYLISYVENCLDFFENEISFAEKLDSVDSTRKHMVKILAKSNKILELDPNIVEFLTLLEKMVENLDDWDIVVSRNIIERLQNGPKRWFLAKGALLNKREMVLSSKDEEMKKLRRQNDEIKSKLKSLTQQKANGPLSNYRCNAPYDHINEMAKDLLNIESQVNDMTRTAKLFGEEMDYGSGLPELQSDLEQVKFMWDHVIKFRADQAYIKTTNFGELDFAKWQKIFAKDTENLDSVSDKMKNYPINVKLKEDMRMCQVFLNVFNDLHVSTLLDRHYRWLQQAINPTEPYVRITKDVPISKLLELKFHEQPQMIDDLIRRAQNEYDIDQHLQRISREMSNLRFEYESYEPTRSQLVVLSDRLFETLKDADIQLSELATRQNNENSLLDIQVWRAKLQLTESVLLELNEVQEKWRSMQQILQNPDDEQEILHNLDDQQSPDDEQQISQNPDDEQEILHNLDDQQSPDDEQQISQNPDDEQEILHNLDDQRSPDDEQQISQNPDDEREILQNSDDENRILQNSDDKQQISQNPEDEKQILQNSDDEQKIVPNPEDEQQNSQNPGSGQQISQNPDVEQRILPNPDDGQQILQNPDDERQILQNPEDDGETNNNNESIDNFSDLSKDFVDLAKLFESGISVVMACTAQEGLLERLKKLHSRLERIDSKLLEGLKHKRTVFPRFYFLSTKDQKEIYNLYRIPEKIQHHIHKLFEGIHRLEFQDDANSAVKMISFVSSKLFQSQKFLIKNSRD